MDDLPGAARLQVRHEADVPEAGRLARSLALALGFAFAAYGATFVKP